MVMKKWEAWYLILDHTILKNCINQAHQRNSGHIWFMIIEEELHKEITDNTVGRV